MFKVNVIKISIGFLMLAFCAVPTISFADWSIGIGVGGGDRHHDDHAFYRWHDRPHWGYHMHYLPAGYFTILVGGQKYYYYDGLYYTYVGYGDYVLVQPPIGAYVTAIPPDFQPVIVNGRTYYMNDGVYYVLTHHGYKVVVAPVVYQQQVVVQQAAPVVVQQPQQVVVTQVQPPVDSQDTFPVNIPNDKGGYTSVVIKKSGTGYVGPQGEFYAAFPTVAQLKAMYGK